MAGTGWEQPTTSSMRGRKAPPAHLEASSERPSRGRLGWEEIYGERPSSHGGIRSRGIAGVGPPFPSWVTGPRANHGELAGPERGVPHTYSSPNVLSPVVVEAGTWRNAAGDSRNEGIADKQAAKRRKIHPQQEVVDITRATQSIRASPAVPVHVAHRAAARESWRPDDQPAVDQTSPFAEPRPHQHQPQPCNSQEPLGLVTGLRGHNLRPGQSMSSSRLSNLALQLRGAPFPPRSSSAPMAREPGGGGSAFRIMPPMVSHTLRRRPVRFALNGRSSRAPSAAAAAAAAASEAPQSPPPNSSSSPPVDSSDLQQQQQQDPREGNKEHHPEAAAPEAPESPAPRSPARGSGPNTLVPEDLVQFLQEEEDRLRVRYDEEMMDAHLDTLAAQEEEEEMHQRWSRPRRRRPASYEEYLQGMQQASVARDPSNLSLRHRLARLPADARRYPILSAGERRWASSSGARPGPPPPPGGVSAAAHQAGLGDFMFLSGGMSSHVQQLQFLSNQVQAIRQVRDGRLPAHLLLSDRDFDENDYEALLALDEGIENHKGAKKADIEALKTEVFEEPSIAGEHGAGCGASRCTVCLEDPVKGEVMRVLPCGHRFHQACIDQWLGVKACCPICQGDVREENREAPPSSASNASSVAAKAPDTPCR